MNASVATVADLLEELGGIPPERILMHPAPGTATEKDLLTLLDGRSKRICELVNGVLVEKAMGAPESLLAFFIARLLDNFVRAHDLGVVFVADTPQRLWKGRVRMPAVSYSSWDSVEGGHMPKNPIADSTPELAVEVLSKSNTKEEMLNKRKDYFRVGARVVWEVNPRKKMVTVYRSPNRFKTLVRGDILTGDPVLPGFSVAVSDLFAELDRGK